MKTLYLLGTPIWHSEVLNLPKMKKEISVKNTSFHPHLITSIYHFKLECRKLDEELAQKTFLQVKKCWLLLLCFWVLIKQWGTSGGEFIWWIKSQARWLKQEVERSLFVQLHGSEEQVFACWKRSQATSCSLRASKRTSFSLNARKWS